MKCPICGKDLELQKKQIGTNENGDPIFNEYAICRDCRKQWNLDKQRAKRMAAKKAAQKADAPTEISHAASATRKVAEKPAESKPSAPKPTSQKNPEKAVRAEKPAAEKNRSAESAREKRASDQKKPAEKGVTRRPAARSAEAASGDVPRRKPADGQARRRPKPGAEVSETGTKPAPARKPVRKRPVQDTKAGNEEEKRYSNIPSERVRTKHEKAVRQGYEDMLATGTIGKPEKGRKSKADEDTTAIRRPGDKNNAVKQTPPVKPSTKKAEVDDYDDDDDDYYDDEPRFRAMRIILGILSVAGFAFFIYRGFMTGLTSTANETGTTSGITYIVVALCLLVAALLYFIMNSKATVFAFLLPMVFYLGGGVFAFLQRGDDLQLLIAAVAGGVLAVISLILAIASRGGGDEDDDYDDAFDDDYADDDYDD